MTSKTVWERFFDGHAPVYMENSFTANTIAEVDFLIAELGLAEGAAVLDVGCGTGRHAIELARRGFVVTGVDLSAGMLAQARATADAANVRVQWIHADATTFSADARFDAVICLCEGAFGLLGAGDDALGQPLAILRTVAGALKPRARCLFTVLNGFAMARRHPPEAVAQGTFDPLALSEVSECTVEGEGGSVSLRERGFVPTELVLLFRAAGLHVLHVWGGTAGNWGRRLIDLDEMEIMVVAERAAG